MQIEIEDAGINQEKRLASTNFDRQEGVLNRNHQSIKKILLEVRVRREATQLEGAKLVRILYRSE